ncbi:hypothetical protein B0I08_104272 [Glaciihabitans tibetensis]|uniref:SCP2 domain-containing protein n=1 Tax=Glaciihabitans tibetensis TaxID=1266600 RepID=A0A2T0VEG9_9MICO|nr:hypothetical protein [Glaciihabitans tibetensis]PRY68569.1 hypothetical protein B0I08_104272 [Glaciihabitans tibetensis]
MLTETDPRVTAYINMYSVLGTLPLLAELVPEAKSILAGVKHPTTIAFRVAGGPRESLTFTRNDVRLGSAPGASAVSLAFTSVTHFNRVIAGTAQPIPWGLPAQLRFLTAVFSPLTDLLGRYLQPTDEFLADPERRETSIILTMHVAASALAQVANEDRSGKFSAHNTPDGDVALEVTGALAYHLRMRDHHATFVATPSPSPRGVLTFSSLEVAGGILSGDLSAVVCISDGRLSMRGYIAMVDNVNRILDRVGHYLGSK